MQYNPLLELPKLGQSLWLDYLRRDMLESGELQRLIENDGIRGITSNPAIFWKAIDGSSDYTKSVRALADQGKNGEQVYRTLTVEDVQTAADIFRPVFDRLEGADGFVSLEVNSHFARNVEATISEARELWRALDRPNVFIKVPATEEGLICIRRLIVEGINVNVTLLFGLDRYREVADAFLSGLEDRLEAGAPLDGISSVASFFLSRIDVKVDPLLDDLKKNGGKQGKTADEIHGEVAVASAKIAYQIYREIFASDRFRRLAGHGARPQRVLWASTSTKNPDYSDVKYVEALIGRDTVNTVPRETLAAYRDHGNPAARLEEHTNEARSVLDRLGELGIEIGRVTSELVEEGIEKFNAPYDRTLESLDKKIREARGATIAPQETLLGKHKDAVSARIAELNKMNFSARLWDKDAGLWSDNEDTRKQIRDALGWLYVAEKMISNVPDLKRFATEVRRAGFRRVVHLGMGGSSLAPLVFQRTFPLGTDGLPLTVLDSTDPRTILGIEEEGPLDDTLFIVASKSGTTTETITFMEYFYDRLGRGKSGGSPGKNFVAITDPGSPLVATAEERGFRRVFLNFADIGGRYSALSYFGMVPAVLMGLEIEELLERAVRMAHANQRSPRGEHNPAVELGALIGEMANRGRDKLTFLTSESVATLGLWLEQLVAESTGKDGRGILPVAGEDIGEPGVYGDDRVFVYFELQDEKYDTGLKHVRRLAEVGHPTIIIRLQDKYDIGQEMMRWEIATATAGAVIGINPFNQPNVQESKDNTNRMLNAAVEGGTSESNAGDPSDIVGVGDSALGDRLSVFLSRARDGDYVAIQAYLTDSRETDRRLQQMRTDLRDGLRIATTVGYGPRYLHSTGQFHKGGPNSGLFIQLVAGSHYDTDVPRKRYSFGVLLEAQADGDLEALRKHDRRVIRIDLGDDVSGGLDRLRKVTAKSTQYRS